MAIALLWHADRTSPGAEMSASDLANALHALHLSSKVNASRLRGNLERHADTVRGSSIGTFKLKLATKSRLSKTYGPLSALSLKPVNKFGIVPHDLSVGSDGFVESICQQINVCYEYEMHDSCAVMMRRIIESQLIGLFSKSGFDSVIRGDDNEYLMLAPIIRITNGKEYIKLSRQSKESLELVKDIGDRAAHHRSYLTRKNDIDIVASKFRALLHELLTYNGSAS
ncbi:MAG: hypothetical protein ABL962_01920 [Fimbriimonadaceae bacterium]